MTRRDSIAGNDKPSSKQASKHPHGSQGGTTLACSESSASDVDDRSHRYSHPTTPKPSQMPKLHDDMATTSLLIPEDQSSVPPTAARPKAQSAPIQFFSFTRSPEGSSLTTCVQVLSVLFPQDERYMISCGEELDIADERKARAAAHQKNNRDRSWSTGSDNSSLSGNEDNFIARGRNFAVGCEEHAEDGEDEDDAEDEQYASSLLKCLQIDLRKFGLGRRNSLSSMPHSLLTVFFR
jgi:hypothetical protein